MITDKITEMGDNLRLLEGHDRLHYLIDKAKDMEPLPEAAKTDENRIRGCASKLWVIGGAKEDGTMMYQVDGDAHISKGTAKIDPLRVVAARKLEIEYAEKKPVWKKIPRWLAKKNRGRV